MLATDWVHISAGVSVLVIAIVLLSTIATSALLGNRMPATDVVSAFRPGPPPVRLKPDTTYNLNGRTSHCMNL
jgi:hypothetical protein